MSVDLSGIEVFGHTAAGEPVYRVEITGGGLTAKVMTWGAVIQDLRLEGHAPPLVLGFEAFDSYPAYSSYFGATPGPCANRIGGGRFVLDGATVQLDLNEKGVTHLHGGTGNLGKQNWSLVEVSSNSVVLRITDAASRAGYPGNTTVTATYTLHGKGVLTVSYASSVDKAGPVNICQHSYFNLDGHADALGHQLMIAADHYLPTNELQVPTGEVRPVEGTPFDFRRLGPMKRSDGDEQALFDHNFCLSDARVAKRKVAEAVGADASVTMEVHTTEPGVQFYAAFKLNVPVPGLDGRTYGPFAGFCMETQVWPDAVNHANFPNAILRPGETLVQETDYIFSRS